ncbi:adenosylcobinamide-phosphate synthase [Balneicella halophila]|uniref:Cobalamin biosynthesis protein CobD n=1 Tax=Balneicella halophila TaxID=1537566 RepID=A0A7L4UNB8_BALHA|nr:adenosylcobinamide-phosphate synthase CbiB [Balneicella halophila]PVX50683.1 adenosylcobinamide-phosphate synthase [Balneicella halophila]
MENLFLYLFVPLVLGWLLDRIFGDPENLPHPIIFFGKAISWVEKKWNQGDSKIVKGGVVAIFFPLVVFILSSAVNIIMFLYCFWLGIIVNTIFVFFGLAGKTLAKEVEMVFEAVEVSLQKGREQIARIVGRDTSQLDEQQIKIAALETLAENLSDGVIAPLFWYALGGVPGMFAYKMTNTLDSMIGYKSEKYRDFGRWSAKIDDVANYIPARLTTLLMLIVSGKISLFPFVLKYGKMHTSPNAGYPESALAGILDCRFGGGNYYFGKFVEKPYIGENERELSMQDMQKSIKVNLKSEILMVIALIIFYGIMLSIMK